MRSCCGGAVAVLRRRHPGLWNLLRGRDQEQALVVLATLSAWVVADSVAATGKPPRALTPEPGDGPAVLVGAGAWSDDYRA